MAHANADMVDTFFIVKFLLKMAEHNDIKSVLSDSHLSKILNLFQLKMNDETNKIQI